MDHLPAAVPGRVYIVGAGPGDPGLITVRGVARTDASDQITPSGDEGSLTLSSRSLRSPTGSTRTVAPALLKDAGGSSCPGHNLRKG